MINIGVLGTGYVGLVTGTCLAGNEYNIVTCMDIDNDKIEKLREGKCPIYERDLEALIAKRVKEYKLFFNSDISILLDTFKVIFIAVGTPSNDNGSVDMTYVKLACDMIKEHCVSPKVIVMKSTVPAGTHYQIRRWVGEQHIIISNPEFLREGTAVWDFQNGDRVVIGTEDGMPNQLMKDVYKEQSDKIIWMDNSSAEMVKYAANCLLATRLALWNEIAILCNFSGASINEVKRGVGSDTRIGSRFLLAGPGYGGSCFPKDTRGLYQMFVDMARGKPLQYGKIIESVISSNENHKKAPYHIFKNETFLDKIDKIAILGLAFKSDTDDVRESPTNTLLQLLDEDDGDFKIVVADPVATQLPENLKREVVVTTDFVKAVQDADVIILMTEWPQYKSIDLDYIKSLMKGRLIIDARNMWNSMECRKRGFCYKSIGNGD